MDINFYNVYLNVALFGKPDSAVYFPNIYKGFIDTSGVMLMQYDGFVSSCAGSKDTWGEKRGGRARLKKGSYEVPINSKSLKNVNEKEGIARYAASLVKDGESIFRYKNKQ